MENIKNFLNLSGEISCEVDELNELVRKIFLSFKEVLNINIEEYPNIKVFTQKMIETDDINNKYFWEWLDEVGIKSLNKILTYGSDYIDDELLDLIDYRLMLLEMDIENKIPSSLFISIADTLKAIVENIEAKINQMKLNVEDHYELSENFIRGKIITYKENSSWSFTDPADFQQDFCYYM